MVGQPHDTAGRGKGKAAVGPEATGEAINFKDMSLVQEPFRYGFNVDKKFANYRFMLLLNRSSTEPMSSSDFNNTLTNIAKRTEPEQMGLLMASFRQQSSNVDVDDVSTAYQLYRMLETQFNVIRVAKEAALVHTDWSIEEQIKHYDSKSFNVYQLFKRRGDEGRDLRRMAGADLQRIFSTGGAVQQSETGVHVPGLINGSGHTLRPSPVDEHDLVNLIRARDGNLTSAYTCFSSYDWLDLTHAPSATPFNVDTSGYCTAVVGIQGESVWYVPRGHWDRNRRTYSVFGGYGTGYPDKLGAFSLSKGECIIYAPGTIHATTTLSNALVARYFFYTAPHFARTIKCMHFHFRAGLDDDEVVKTDDFHKLALIVRNLDDSNLFSPEQRKDIWSTMTDLLSLVKAVRKTKDGRIVPRWKETEAIKIREEPGATVEGTAPSVSNEPAKTSEFEVAKSWFLRSCFKWWISYRGTGERLRHSS